MQAELNFLLNHCVAPAFDKQLYLHDLVDQLEWRFDLSSGLLSFGNYLQWQTQILGTEAEATQTWLWSWANPTAGIPEPLLEMARKLKAMGDENQIAEFSQAELSLEEVDGHTLALVASVVFEADAYFRAPHEGGAVFLLIKDARFRRDILQPLERILTVFPQVISSLDVTDHRCALESYLLFYGLQPEQAGNTLLVTKNALRLLTATFDDQERLLSLEASLGPNEPQ